MSLIIEITRAKRLAIGDISLVYEYFDLADRQVMLVINDSSLPWLKRSRPHNLESGAVLHLTNGVRVILQPGATQKRARLGIINPEKLHIKVTKRSCAVKVRTLEAAPSGG